MLAAQFESFVDPLVIMLLVPLSMIGLITKDGILIVDFTNQLRMQGMEMIDALVKASSQRLRPILMTTGAMMLGALPLASGEGTESRTQIGWVIVGGMSLVTLLTVFVVPAMYTLFDRTAVTGGQHEGGLRKRRITSKPTSLLNTCLK